MLEGSLTSETIAKMSFIALKVYELFKALRLWDTEAQWAGLNFPGRELKQPFILRLGYVLSEELVKQSIATTPWLWAVAPNASIRLFVGYLVGSFTVTRSNLMFAVWQHVLAKISLAAKINLEKTTCSILALVKTAPFEVHDEIFF